MTAVHITPGRRDNLDINVQTLLRKSAGLLLRQDVGNSIVILERIEEAEQVQSKLGRISYHAH